MDEQPETRDKNHEPLPKTIDQAPMVFETPLGELKEGLSGLRLCSPEALRDMKRSLETFGQIAAVLVNRTSGGLEVVDGFKRLRASRALGWTRLRVQIEELDGIAAKLRLWQSNSSHGLTEVEEAWLVRALYREEHLSQPQIAVMLRRHKSWVCRRLMLVEGLGDELTASVRLGLLTATVARELSRLPRGNQDEVARVVTRRGLTSRQTARLVDDLLRIAANDQQARQKVLECAGQRVAASKGTSKTSKQTPGEHLVADALALRRIAARLHTRLLARSLGSLGEEAGVLAARELQELGRALLALYQTMERRLTPYMEGAGYVSAHD